jgi:hypothetical protein
MTTKELYAAIDSYVVASGGRVTSLEDSQVKVRLRHAVASFATEATSEAHDDGYDDGYEAGSRDAKKAREDAEAARKEAVAAKDLLARLADALGWDRWDVDKFERFDTVARTRSPAIPQTTEATR